MSHTASPINAATEADAEAALGSNAVRLARRSRGVPGWRVRQPAPEAGDDTAHRWAALRKVAEEQRREASQLLSAAHAASPEPASDTLAADTPAPRMRVIPGGRREHGLGHGHLGLSVDISHFSWRPRGWKAPVLSDINLSIEAGEKVLLVGPSGCGKSTLLRAIAGVLEVTETGDRSGQVRIGGRERAVGEGRVGLLMQNPQDSRVAAKVGRDVAFGPENLSMSRAQIEQRVRWALDVVGFPYSGDHPATAMSGGESQRLSLAGALAMRPGVLLLDEPTSMLHDAAADATRDAILGAVKDSATTVVIVEHNVERWLPHVDRVIVMGLGGHIVADGPAASILEHYGERMAADGLWVPGVRRPSPLSIPAELCCPMSGVEVGERLLTTEQARLVRRHAMGLRAVAPRTEHAAVNGVSLHVNAGDFLVIRGASGAGKSSLLALLCGLEKPTSGHVWAAHALARGKSHRPHEWTSRQLASRCGWVPQLAELSVVGATVEQSVLATVESFASDWSCRVPWPSAAAHRRRAHQRALTARGRERAYELLELLGMSGLAHRNPHQLSGGEMRRMALVSAVAHGPDVLALDEPTMGQDRHTWAAIAGVIAAACEGGAGVVTATHDSELFNHSDESMTLSWGRIHGRSFHTHTDRDRSEPPYNPYVHHSDDHRAAPDRHGLGPHLRQSRERESIRMSVAATWPGRGACASPQSYPARHTPAAAVTHTSHPVEDAAAAEARPGTSCPAAASECARTAARTAMTHHGTRAQAFAAHVTDLTHDAPSHIPRLHPQNTPPRPAQPQKERG